MCIIVLALLAGKSLNWRRLTQKTQTIEHAQDVTSWSRCGKAVNNPRKDGRGLIDVETAFKTVTRAQSKGNIQSRCLKMKDLKPKIQ